MVADLIKVEPFYCVFPAAIRDRKPVKFKRMGGEVENNDKLSSI